MRALAGMSLGVLGLALSACEAGERVHDNPVFSRLEAALVRGDADAAYALMCPEARETVDGDRFARILRAHPYLRGVKSFQVGTRAPAQRAAVMEKVVDCRLENQVGRMYADLYVRRTDPEWCIASLIIAGVPVWGPGPAAAE